MAFGGFSGYNQPPQFTGFGAPQPIGGGVVNVPAATSGGFNPFSALLGIGLGLGTGNWGPLIGSVMGSTGQQVYNSVAGGQTQTNQQGSNDGLISDSQGKDTKNNLDPNQERTLAAGEMVPQLGQPLDMAQMQPQPVPVPIPYQEPEPYINPYQWGV